MDKNRFIEILKLCVCSQVLEKGICFTASSRFGGNLAGTEFILFVKTLILFKPIHVKFAYWWPIGEVDLREEFLNNLIEGLENGTKEYA